MLFKGALGELIPVDYNFLTIKPMDFKFQESNIIQLEGGEPDETRLTPTVAEKTEIKQPKTPAQIWQQTQDALANEAGLSILLIDGQQPPSLAVSNNNSVCRFFQSSYKYAHLCDPFCGKAFDNVQKAGKSISYLCHAGFQCVAASLSPNPIRPLVTIVGRALTKVADYENLLKRRETENWQDSPADELFTNLRFAESEAEIQHLSSRLQNLEQREIKNLIEFVARTEPNPFASSKIELTAEKSETQEKERGNFQRSPSITSESTNETETDKNYQSAANHKSQPQTVANEQIELAEETIPNAPIRVEVAHESFEDFAAWQSFINVLLNKSFKDACAETLQFLTARHGLTSLAWLERSKLLFKLFLVSEDLRDVLKDFTLKVDDYGLQEAVLNETSLTIIKPQKIEIFPLAVGEDVRAAIIIGDEIADHERRFRLARFAHQIAVSLEVLRLREELERRAKVIRAVQVFSEKLNAVEGSAAGNASVNLFDSLLRTCAELLDATRGSLLLYDEGEQKLTVQAAFGTRAKEMKQTREPVGARIAERVWKEGKPLVVENMINISLAPTPSDHRYKSDSFISFPLFVGQRAIGVLNLTDKRTVENSDVIGYNSNDLDLLETIAPQLAIALDRASLQQKAGKFEQLSITDSLTGLLNRRYLDERLNEEVRRSLRDGTPMGFLMIDIDNFKLYNDRFGHQAGDEVLRITAQSLKSVLRGADIAARFGGEEFCLLLPNTTLEEAKLIGERIREQIEDTDFPNQGITVSVGVSANAPLNISPQEIIESADKALYQAKRMGKNNVQLLLFEQSH